jgi:limonene-1,2-epoxide hydrolase
VSEVAHADAVALFERRRDAWLAGDLDAYLALFAPDLVIDIPRRGRIVGRDAYADLVRRSHEHVAPVRFELHHLGVHGSIVLSEWTIEIEFRADRRRATYDGMSRCELRDGLIASWREYYDPAQLTSTD